MIETVVLGAGPAGSTCANLLAAAGRNVVVLDKNPFPDGPPRYVRGRLYEYHFTDAATRRATKAWWRREPRGPFGPVLTLENGRLVTMPGGAVH